MNYIIAQSVTRQSLPFFALNSSSSCVVVCASLGRRHDRLLLLACLLLLLLAAATAVCATNKTPPFGPGVPTLSLSEALFRQELLAPMNPNPKPGPNQPSAPIRRPRSQAVVVISSDDEDACSTDCISSAALALPDCVITGSSRARQRTSAAAPPSPLPRCGMYLTTVQVRRATHQFIAHLTNSSLICCCP